MIISEIAQQKYNIPGYGEVTFGFAELANNGGQVLAFVSTNERLKNLFSDQKVIDLWTEVSRNVIIVYGQSQLKRMDTNWFIANYIRIFINGHKYFIRRQEIADYLFTISNEEAIIPRRSNIAKLRDLMPTTGADRRQNIKESVTDVHFDEQFSNLTSFDKNLRSINVIEEFTARFKELFSDYTSVPFSTF